MKKIAIVAMFMAGLLTTANAEVIYVDFYDNGTTNFSPETYNVLHSGAGNGQNHPVATAGAGLSMAGLVDTNGVATGAGVTLHSYSSFRTAAGPANGGAYAHQPVVGIATNASHDAYFINDQGNVASFGFILTFTGLTGDAYDISMLAGSSNAGGTWSVTTGNGDSDTQAYSSFQTEVQEWTSVVPVGGTIELRSLDDGTGNWQTASLNFISLEAVTLASSVLGLLPNTLSLDLEFPDTSIDGTISAEFTPGDAGKDIEIVSLVADAGFSASVVSTTLGTNNVSEDITVTFDNSSIGLANGETTNSTLVVTWTEVGSGVNQTVEATLDVTYTDEPSSLALAPTSLSLELEYPDTTVDGVLVASFVEGSLSTDVQVVSVVADSGFSGAPGSFTLSTANTNQDITVTFDNSSVGLASFGDTTNSTLVVTWTEAGSGVINTSEAALNVTYIPEVPLMPEHGQVIFGATTNNTVLFSNEPQGGGSTSNNIALEGATPDLLLSNDGPDFFYGGFASTNDVDTLNGTPLLADDTIKLSLTVDAVTHTDSAQLRSRGIEWGLAADPIVSGGGSSSNFIVRIGGAGNGAVIALQNGSSGTITSSVFRATTASVEDGFTAFAVLDQDGFTIYFEGLEAVAGAGSGTVWPISGTFPEGHFVDAFGSGHYYAAVQKRLVGTTTLDISEAAISRDVAEAPEFVSGGTSVSNGNVIMAFTGTVGMEYEVESTDNLIMSDSWETVTNFTALPESPMTVELPITDPAAFYRVFTP